MFHKQRSKLQLAIIASIILHIVVIAILGYKVLQSADTISGSVNGKAIDAIMVDPSVMTQQYQRQLQHQINQQQIEQQRQLQIQQQAKELQERQLAEQQRLKDLKKEQLKALEKQQQEIEAALKQKQQAEEQARLAKQKAEQEAKAAADRAAKEAADRAAKEAADKAAEKAAKAAADKAAAKNTKAVDDILGDLTSNNNLSSPTGAPTSQRKGVSNNELDKYKLMVLNAISNKFINPNRLYSGRTCVLRIQIAQDGLLLNVDSQGGDDILCREAITATKLAVIPKPSQDLYQKVKIMTLDFRPQ